MVPVKDPKVNGAQLLKELAATGTAAAKLLPASQLLAFVHRKEKRIADANEVIDVLERCGLPGAYEGYPATPDLTLRKARAIAEKGKWDGITEVAELPVWETLLAGQELPDEKAPTLADQAAEAFDPAAPCKMEDALELKPAKRNPAPVPPKPAPKPVPMG